MKERLKEQMNEWTKGVTNVNPGMTEKKMNEWLKCYSVVTRQLKF